MNLNLKQETNVQSNQQKKKTEYKYQYKIDGISKYKPIYTFFKNLIELTCSESFKNVGSPAPLMIKESPDTQYSKLDTESFKVFNAAYSVNNLTFDAGVKYLFP